jgi:hypothetical protein
VPPTRGDWIFVWAVIGVLFALALIPVLLGAWLLSSVHLI